MQEGLRNRLRHDATQTERAAAQCREKPPNDNFIVPTKVNIPQETCESLFASSGTIGVVDLGASQSVIGSQQVPELMSQLPLNIQKQVRRTDCHLIFRFGNHQTLTSRHAILFPLNREWFRVAVVTGNTPFLLSSKFLRETIGAIIDTVDGTMWSKKLQRNLAIEMSPKNLFLLDINQLWEDKNNKGHPKLETLHVQVQAGSEVPDQSDTGPFVGKTEPSTASCMSVPEPKITSQTVDRITSNPRSQEKDSMVGQNSEKFGNLGPKFPDPHHHSSSSQCAVIVNHGSQHGVPEDEGIPSTSKGQQGPDDVGASGSDDLGRSVSRDNPIRSSEEGLDLSRGLQGPTTVGPTGLSVTTRRAANPNIGSSSDLWN